MSALAGSDAGSAPAASAASGASAGQHHAAPGATGADAGSDPVLTRLKELDAANVEKEQLIEKLTKELKSKDEHVKVLSADKRAEMQTFMTEVVDQWLNSLDEVPDDSKKSFRAGLEKIADAADTRNPAWEMVCCASRSYKSNVQKMESAVQQIASLNKKIEDLSGFRNAAAQIARDPVAGGGGSSASSSAYESAMSAGNKRARMDAEGRGGGQSSVQEAYNYFESGVRQGGMDAWDSFDSLMRQNSRSIYS